MFSFLDQVRAYLQTNTTFNGVIKLSGTLEGTKKSTVSIYPVPTRPGERYVLGKNKGIAFQILVKDPSEVAAMQLIDELTTLCEVMTRSVIPNLVQCEVYVTPNFVEKTATNEYIYTALFQAEIEGGI